MVCVAIPQHASHITSNSSWFCCWLRLTLAHACMAARVASSQQQQTNPVTPVTQQSRVQRHAIALPHPPLALPPTFRHVQQQLDARSGPDNQQGVLIVAGGRDMFANAAISITVLRNHIRSSIPVEIVHFGPSELPAPELLAYIKTFNGSGIGPADSTSTSSVTSSTDRNGTDSTSTSSSSDQGVLGPVFVTDALEVAPPEKAAPLHRKLPEGFKSFPAKVYALTHVTRFRKVCSVCWK